MALNSRKRKKSRKKRPLESTDPGDPPYLNRHIRAEFDSHADTCAFVEEQCRVLGKYGTTMTVGGYHGEIGSLNSISTADVAVAYDCPKTGETVILVFHHILLIPRLKTHLLNPYQIRNQGIIVNDTPLHHLPPDQRQPTSHSVICEDPEFQIPLTLNGVMSGFDVRRPTLDEVNDPSLLKIHMTSDIAWDPSATVGQEIEEALRNHLERGYDLVHQEPRQLGTLQVRGQSVECSGRQL